MNFAAEAPSEAVAINEAISRGFTKFINCSVFLFVVIILCWVSDIKM